MTFLYDLFHPPVRTNIWRKSIIVKIVSTVLTFYWAKQHKQWQRTTLTKRSYIMLKLQYYPTIVQREGFTGATIFNIIKHCCPVKKITGSVVFQTDPDGYL